MDALSLARPASHLPSSAFLCGICGSVSGPTPPSLWRGGPRKAKSEKRPAPHVFSAALKRGFPPAARIPIPWADAAHFPTGPGRRAALPMKLSVRIARIVVHHRPWAAALLVLLLAGAAALISSRQRLDSDILNLLPQRAPAIASLKTLSSQFRQGRELIFALHGEPDAVAAHEEAFLAALRAQPWVRRVYAGSPMESPEEIAALQGLLPSLLLNLNDAPFDSALAALQPAALESRVARLRELLAAGSPRAETEAAIDPLGVAALALQPMASLSGLEKSQPLGAADGSLRIFPVVTDQAAQDQASCQATMEKAEAFLKELRAQWAHESHPSSDPPAPELLLTGRAAYVTQIAATMQRDVTVTSLISLATVTLLFVLGFRRLLPPLVTSLILGVSCFFAFTTGCLLFDNLNVIAIAFCSILVGLGDDFSLLLYNRYLLARVHHEPHEQAVATSIGEMGPGILWVALTTGAGFLVLLLSGSSGFAQLGTLIAVGVVLCALLVLALLFLFIPPTHAQPEKPDPLLPFFNAFTALLLRLPARRAILLLLGGATLILFAALPVRPLAFDTNPRSLEPKQIPAAIALRAIHDKIPAADEAVALLVDAPDPESAHRSWQALEKRLREMTDAGELAGFSSPAGLMLSPERLARHRQQLRASLDINASRAAFTRALESAGFDPGAFQAGFAFLDQLRRAAAEGDDAAQLRLEDALPADSSWWFLLDRYLSTRPLLATAYVRTARPLATPAEEQAFEASIARCGVPVQVTGWTYSMVSIVPWAKGELAFFSAAIGGLILVCLGLAYRRWAPWLVHVLSLAIALAGCLCLLKLTGTRINLLNALAFPLILGVGVDYGMHLLMALQEGDKAAQSLSTVLKPLVISGLTTVAGFGALIFARNPALQGLGTVCAIGVTSCLLTSVFFSVPVMAAFSRRHPGPGKEAAGKSMAAVP